MHRDLERVKQGNLNAKVNTKLVPAGTQGNIWQNAEPTPSGSRRWINGFGGQVKDEGEMEPREGSFGQVI